MLLQLTIDHGKRHEVLNSVDLLASHVDIVEIGYPQIVTFGLELVKEIREKHPDLCICVDAKVFRSHQSMSAPHDGPYRMVRNRSPSPMCTHMV